MELWNWFLNLSSTNKIGIISAIGTLLSAIATTFIVCFNYFNLKETKKQADATQKQVKNATEQLKETWRSIILIKSQEHSPRPMPNFKIWLTNQGIGPAINVCIYISSSNFFGEKKGSFKLKVGEPLRPDLLYEFVAVKSKENKLEVPEKKVDFAKQILDIADESKIGPPLPNKTLVVITFEDISGQKRWLKYTGGSILKGKHNYGEGVPEFLKKN